MELYADSFSLGLTQEILVLVADGRTMMKRKGEPHNVHSSRGF